LISGIDHVVIAVRDLAASVAAYETLLNRAASPVQTADGVATALIPTCNIAVELMAPVAPGDSADRLRVALEDGEGLKSLVFAVSDIERMHKRCERVGLAPQAIAERDNWRSFRADTERTHGVRLFFMERGDPLASSPGGGLDHIVIRTSDPERAAALYGARLGLDMRLDREVTGRRLMFFRCGDAVVEIVHDPALVGRDTLWGLSWRVANADAERERLANAGLDVSDVRAGMKPGTRVFTARDGTSGVPTLMIEPSPRRD
jgi:catechol 2,3-dioxygenase-like lactoylglutathione lyase family enzyme